MNLSRDKGKGQMAFCMELESVSAITRAVFMSPEEAKVSDADIKDVTSEICNQICGKSKLALKMKVIVSILVFLNTSRTAMIHSCPWST